MPAEEIRRDGGVSLGVDWGMARVFDVGLIGAGGFARNHISVLEGLQEKGAARAVAVADPQIARIAAEADWKYKAGLRLYDDYRKLVVEESCDLIGIATPPFLHFEMVETVLAQSRAFLYLEKPPVPLFTQLEKLAHNPEAWRVAVGFQFLESDLIRQVKRRLIAGEIGQIRAIRASSATPRADSYYQRNGWAGRLAFAGNPVFDGPASNGLAHLVHLIMYFAGASEEGFAVPERVSGRFLRARPIESYDFAYLQGTLERGAAYEIAVGHCSHEALPWTVRIEGTRGEIVFRQRDIRENRLNELLHLSYESVLQFVGGKSSRPTTRLSDCAGYLQAVCGGFVASQGVADMEFVDIREVGEGADRIFSVQKAIDLIRGIAEGKSAVWFDIPAPVEAVKAARQEGLMDRNLSPHR